MKSRLRHTWVLGAVGLAGAGLGCSSVVGDKQTDETSNAIETSAWFSDAFGTTQVISTDAVNGLDLNNPFFQNLGINGRTCNSCHKLDNSLGISVAKVQSIFNATAGLDPIFRINDGSNAPVGFYANTSTVDARRTSFSMLLNHGVIRVGIGVSNTADFTLLLAQDPYYFASSSELSLFRRPLPSVNVAFNTLTMWDGRESEGRPVNRDARRNLVGDLTLRGCDISASEEEPGECEPARGGPTALADVLIHGSAGDFPAFFPGINDPLPVTSTGTPSST